MWSLSIVAFGALLRRFARGFTPARAPRAVTRDLNFGVPVRTSRFPLDEPELVSVLARVECFFDLGEHELPVCFSYRVGALACRHQASGRGLKL